MNWQEFKQLVESSGINNNSSIKYIDLDRFVIREGSIVVEFDRDKNEFWIGG